MKALCVVLTLVILACAALAPAERRVVLGKLGQVTEVTRIHAAPNTRSRVFYRARAFEYIVLRDAERQGWFRVLMSNGLWGYIQADTVARLPYNVTHTPSSRPGGNVASRGALAQYALNYTGTPYEWGGNDMRNGVDCSGFVKNLFGRIGVNLPRTAARQARVGKPIYRLEDLKPGDRLYFWERRRNTIGHTGIYLGNGFFVHSSRGRGGVATDDLRKPTWRNTLVAARR
jgi:hypothetical protein